MHIFMNIYIYICMYVYIYFVEAYPPCRVSVLILYQIVSIQTGACTTNYEVIEKLYVLLSLVLFIFIF